MAKLFCILGLAALGVSGQTPDHLSWHFHSNTDAVDVKLEFGGATYHKTLHRRPAPLATNLKIRVDGEAVQKAPEVLTYVSGTREVLTLVDSHWEGMLEKDGVPVAVSHVNNRTVLTQMEKATSKMSSQEFGSIDPWYAARGGDEICYPNDHVPHLITIGIAMGSLMYQNHGFDMYSAASYVVSMIEMANMVYKAQLNIELVLGALEIITQDDADAPVWNQGTKVKGTIPETPDPVDLCPMTAAQQLGKFQTWEKPSAQGLWHVLDDCCASYLYPYCGRGTIDGLCPASSLRSYGGLNANQNVAVSWDDTENGGPMQLWRVCSHVVGHNLGAHHSFFDGEGDTGGLMDVGDGTYQSGSRAVFQFHPRQRKHICEHLYNSVEEDCEDIQRVGFCQAADTVTAYYSGDGEEYDAIIEKRDGPLIQVRWADGKTDYRQMPMHVVYKMCSPTGCQVGNEVWALYQPSGSHYEATIHSMTASTITVNWKDGASDAREMNIADVVKSCAWDPIGPNY